MCAVTLWIAATLLPVPALAQIVLDGTLGPPGPLSGPNFQIGAGLGQRRGGNLFHSFGDFNVRLGESATFTGPAGIDHVISRVTGGGTSTVDGVLRSEIAGASLWLLNPAGVLFGRTARLDVSGSVHAATGDYLRLGDGAKFHASTGKASTLSMAHPAAFGFASAKPSAITMRSDQFFLPDRQTLSLVGGEVRLEGALIRAPSGRVSVAGVAAPGEVVLRAPDGSATLEAGGVAALGPVTLTGATILASSDALGGGNGSVVVRAGRLQVTGNSFVVVNNVTTADGAALAVDLGARGALLVDDSIVSSGTFGAGRGGGIRVEGRTVAISGGAFVFSDAVGGHGGGDIALIGRESIAVTGQPSAGRSAVLTRTFGAAPAGRIGIEAGSLTVTDGGQIMSTTSGSGAAGRLDVDVRDAVTLGGQGAGGVSSGFFSMGTFGSQGASGAIHVTAQTLSVTDLAEISSSSSGQGAGGRVDLDVGRLEVARGAVVTTSTQGAGASGALRVRAREAITISGAEVSSESFGTGAAGALELVARRGRVTLDGAVLDSSNGIGSAADGGEITIRARALMMDGASEIMASTFGAGRAGNIDIDVDHLAMASGSMIGSDSFGAGRAGDIRLAARSMHLLDGSQVTSTASSQGDGGNLVVDVAGTLSIRGNGGAGFSLFPSALLTTTEGGSRGDAGTIAVTAGRIVLRNGGEINSSTFGSGDAGTITVVADRLTIAGDGSLVLTGIVSGTALGASGRGGRLDVTADHVTLIDRGVIATATLGAGPAGRIEVRAGTLALIDAGVISSSSFSEGAAGSVAVTATEGITLSGGEERAIILPYSFPPRIVMTNSRIDSTAFGTGRGGSVTVTTPGTFSASGPRAGLFTTAAGDEAADVGGDIGLSAGDVRLTAGARISAESRGAGDAGNIHIRAGLFSADGGRVSTEATSADGGNITFELGRGMHLIDSAILAAVGQDEGAGGNILIDPDFVVLDGSRIQADAFRGPGGNVTIVTRVFLASPDSVLSASSALGISGTVSVQAPITDTAGAVAPLAGDFVAAAALLRERCATRAGGPGTSRFAVRGRGGVPAGPDEILASPLADRPAADAEGVKTPAPARLVVAWPPPSPRERECGR
jgi:filamentous hemagglutinin family protein